MTHLSILSLALMINATQAAIYVSPNGSDAANGSENAPVKTVQQALTISVSKNDPTILFQDGTYHLNGPLELLAQHSGSVTKPRVFKAIHEGKVIFSAGTKVNAKWTLHKDGIYKSTIPASLDLTKGCDGLYIKGEQPRMARFPNYDKNARWLKGSSAESFSPTRIKTWKDPKDGILHAMHKSHWGGTHFTITGKKSDTECSLVGGWMNNRGNPIHPTDRFVENIFEELDTTQEWYLNKQTRTLYYKPVNKLPQDSEIILSTNESIIRANGTDKQPVKHITFEGISFQHTVRTFMKTKEALLRSDWRIYRGGAVFLVGAENVTIKNCEFTNLGGNAFFASGYNKDHLITGSHFHQIGAGAINFVGSTDAVYNPRFDPYGRPDAWEKINKIDKGPKTNEYPRSCVATDSLIHDIGLVEKQVAGLQISVAHKITGSHLSIYDVPRSGINISENAFGGHLIDQCDVFDTVQESSDHGSFNSWGRDRFWHTNYGLVNKQVAEYPELPLIDMLDKNIIRNSRWRCDHGWDIDLDDGSSGYLVENNLCLKGGIKLREGYHREVKNNLVVSDTFHPHVWFNKSDDIIHQNIWATPYQAIRLGGKGKLWDNNIHLTSAGFKKAQQYGVDKNAAFIPLTFKNPDKLDYRFDDNTLTKKIGFKQFDLTKFGVQKASLKKIARTPQPPTLNPAGKQEVITYSILGAELKNVTTLGEVSSTGLPNMQGALLISVGDGFAKKAGLKSLDVIRSINGKAVSNTIEMLEEWAKAGNKPVKAIVWRTQQENQMTLPAFPGAFLAAADAKLNGGVVYDKNKNYIGAWSGNGSLKWDVKLPNNKTFKVLINQAYQGDKPQKWSLLGLNKSVTEEVKATNNWEKFSSVLSKGSASSKDTELHHLTLKRQQANSPGPLLNLRSIILIEE